MTTLEAIDHEIDDDLEIIAGRTALYVTEPHGWKVSRVLRVIARRGRLSVELHGKGYIYDSEDYTEDEHQYGVPSSSAEAQALADLYREAEDILAAYRSGEYVPPPVLPVYRNNRPKDRSLLGLKMAAVMPSMLKTLNMNSWGDGLAEIKISRG